MKLDCLISIASSRKLSQEFSIRMSQDLVVQLVQFRQGVSSSLKNALIDHEYFECAQGDSKTLLVTRKSRPQRPSIDRRQGIFSP